MDPAELQQLKNASGFTSVMINIQPMTTTVSMFLGLSVRRRIQEFL